MDGTQRAGGRVTTACDACSKRLRDAIAKLDGVLAVEERQRAKAAFGDEPHRRTRRQPHRVVDDRRVQTKEREELRDAGAGRAEPGGEIRPVLHEPPG